MNFNYKIPGVILFSYKELNSRLVAETICRLYVTGLFGQKSTESHYVALAVWPRLAPI